MSRSLFCLLRKTVPSLAVVLVLCFSAYAKMPDGYKDIKLGMKKGHVLELLQRNSIHFTFDDVGNEVGEIIRGDDLFRHATYRFDSDGVLVQITLQMREVLGREKCLELYNNQNGLKLVPNNTIVGADMTIEVRDNALILKKSTGNEPRAAKAKGPS